MSENAMGRRQALRGAGIAAGGVAIAGLATAAPAMADSPNGLLGSWLSVRQDDGTTDQVTLILSLAGGGVVISHDISPAGPPFTGTWAAQGKSFQATFWTGFPGQGPGSVGNMARVQLQGALSRGNISGTYVVSVFAPGSTTDVIQAIPGKLLSGTRISA